MKNKILKATLLLRKVGNKYQTKEEQIKEFTEWYTSDKEADLDEWIESLKEELAKTPEQLEVESQEFIERLMEAEAEQARMEMQRFEDEYYSPSCPWNAPGMSVRDFI